MVGRQSNWSSQPAAPFGDALNDLSIAENLPYLPDDVSENVVADKRRGRHSTVNLFLCHYLARVIREVTADTIDA